jgi:hypothetical protein
VQRVLWPTHWDNWGQAAILVAVGVVVATITKVTGEPGSVELLVDNIHVAGGTDEDFLRSLIPVRSVHRAAAASVRKRRSCRRPARSGRGWGARLGWTAPSGAP